MSSYSINNPVNLSESDIEKRLKEWEEKISIESLTSDDIVVHNRHLEAIKVGSKICHECGMISAQLIELNLIS